MLFITKEKIRRLIEILFTVLLFGTQTIFNLGLFISVMITPLLFYLFMIPDVLKTNPIAILIEIAMLYPNNVVLTGQIIFYIGLIVFVLASLQWIWYRHINAGLFIKGLYSKSRHPQFLGIIVVTLGLTIMELIFRGANYFGPFFHGDPYLGVPQLTELWFLQVLGYIAIAWYEDRHLSKDFSEYKQYKQKVPFLWPIKNPKIIPEVLFTIFVVVGICVILFLLPYDFIRVNSYKYIPVIPFP
jgi:protein-S-isoprenylcysteine O-methyltransferase Ste14